MLICGLLAALIGAELILAALDQPRFYAKYPARPRFDVATQWVDGSTFYVNLRSAQVRVEYDGDPRGYFGPDHALTYRTNSLGFRGPEFQPAKTPDALRLMFLGDSFTFGEGVRFEDTYPELTATLLQRETGAGRRIEALNFGVGGYNTTQALTLLKMHLETFSPDIVVLGYVLNDAEPSLIEFDPATETVLRRPRERFVPEGIADPVPPDSFLYKFRATRLVWQFFSNRRLSRATIAHYHALYEPSSPGWLASRRAMDQIGGICQSRGIPFVVVLFPILVELTENYPFGEIHARVTQAVADSGGIPVDLFPGLKGRQARDLWVHPTDQHPNEQVHAIAARAVSDRLRRLPSVPGRSTAGRPE